jgi:hypothetical protein
VILFRINDLQRNLGLSRIRRYFKTFQIISEIPTAGWRDEDGTRSVYTIASNSNAGLRRSARE